MMEPVFYICSAGIYTGYHLH